MAKEKNRGNRNRLKPKQETKDKCLSAYQQDKQKAKSTRKARK